MEDVDQHWNELQQMIHAHFEQCCTTKQRSKKRINVVEDVVRALKLEHEKELSKLKVVVQRLNRQLDEKETINDGERLRLADAAKQQIEMERDFKEKDGALEDQQHELQQMQLKVKMELEHVSQQMLLLAERSREVEQSKLRVSQQRGELERGRAQLQLDRSEVDRRAAELDTRTQHLQSAEAVVSQQAEEVALHRSQTLLSTSVSLQKPKTFGAMLHKLQRIRSIVTTATPPAHHRDDEMEEPSSVLSRLSNSIVIESPLKVRTPSKR